MKISHYPARTFRRYSVDFQIPDTYPHLMADFDIDHVLDHICRTGHVDSYMQYSNSHGGMCFFQTRFGKPHANMGQRDYFREVVEACRKRDLTPVAYFSVVYDNWGYAEHPDWRCVWQHGSDDILRGRYGYCCPNSNGYREYVANSTRQLCSEYDIGGIFFDMTFWAGICYCPSCITKFRSLHGEEPPRTCDWKNPLWRKFLTFREDSIVEFGNLLKDTAKATRPGITVSHQFSSVWTLLGRGVPSRFAQCTDYVTGDFYGDYTMHSLACKMYEDLTPSKPFEHASCFTHNYLLHSAYKTRDLITLESLVSTLHSGAFLMLHAAETDGRMNTRAYEMTEQIAAEKTALEPFLGGDPVADVALFFDDQSVFNYDRTGCTAHEIAWDDSAPHKKGVAGIAKVCIESHIPWGIVTNHTLHKLKNFKAVILSAAWGMNEKNSEIIRQFVRDGGILIATGQSSLDKINGTDKFYLEDVLGVKWEKVTNRWNAFIRPIDQDLLDAVFPHELLEFIGPFQRVKAFPGTEVLATITHPHVDPYIGNPINHLMTAVHSNPPSPTHGDEPAITVHTYGKGKAIYVASHVDVQTSEPGFFNLFKHLIERYVPARSFEAAAHPAVEITLHDQPENNRLLVGLLNTQTVFPQIPVPATVRIRIPTGKKTTSIHILPTQEQIAFETKGDFIEFTVKPFTFLRMVVVNF